MASKKDAPTVQVTPWGFGYGGVDPATDWLPGVPARDVSLEELAELGIDPDLLSHSSLYTPLLNVEEIDPEAAPPPTEPPTDQPSDQEA